MSALEFLWESLSFQVLYLRTYMHKCIRIKAPCALANRPPKSAKSILCVFWLKTGHKKISVQLQKSWCKTAALRLGFIALRPPAYIKGRGQNQTSPYAVWHRQGARVASQRSPILPGDSKVIQHVCRWHKALNPKKLRLKYPKIKQLFRMRTKILKKILFFY